MHLYGVGSSYHIQLLFGAMRTGRQDKRPDGRDVKIYFSRFLLPARVFFYVSVSASAKKKIGQLLALLSGGLVIFRPVLLVLLSKGQYVFISKHLL